ncbi:hypothetical protein ACFLSJ_06400 [Verrucomicrobiota bacterium]
MRAAVVVLVVLASGLTAVTVTAQEAGGDDGALSEDVYLFAGSSHEAGAPWHRAIIMGPVVKSYDPEKTYAPLSIEYPADGGTVDAGPPAPAFRWRDSNEENRSWVVRIGFETTPHHVYVLVRGAQAKPQDSGGSVTNGPSGEATVTPPGRAWTPSPYAWDLVTRNAGSGQVTVIITGLPGGDKVTSAGTASFTVSQEAPSTPPAAPE